MTPLKGKIAIVTGSSRGIGRAIAERLGGDGASVIVNYSGGAEQAGEVASLIESRGSRAFAVQADISRAGDVRRLFDETEARFGRPDILVNNAGISFFKPVAETTDDDFDRMFGVNARGTFFALREAATRISAGGRVVNVSTGGTTTGAPGGAIYCASKAAVEQFTLCLAKELGARGITVNTVSPGLTDTDMSREVAPSEMRTAAVQMSPLGRLGEPRDIADVVAFLVSEDARWLTGQNIRATGGW